MPKSASTIDYYPTTGEIDEQLDAIDSENVQDLPDAIRKLKANGFRLTDQGPIGIRKGRPCMAMVWRHGTETFSDIQLARLWDKA